MHPHVWGARGAILRDTRRKRAHVACSVLLTRGHGFYAQSRQAVTRHAASNSGGLHNNYVTVQRS
jgi:hypothetical protein